MLLHFCYFFFLWFFLVPALVITVGSFLWVFAGWVKRSLVGKIFLVCLLIVIAGMWKNLHGEQIPLDE
jgi:hypothetical protein